MQKTERNEEKGMRLGREEENEKIKQTRVPNCNIMGGEGEIMFMRKVQTWEQHSPPKID